MKVHCDECGWEDGVSALRHLRAWYRAACPVCGEGELIDATEVKVCEATIEMERIGWISTDTSKVNAPGAIHAVLDTAADEILRIVPQGGDVR